VFQHGEKLNAVIHNPVKKMPYLSEKDHIRNNFLLPHDLDKLINASRQTRAKYYLPAIISLGAEHGASKQEILNLTWKNINFSYNDKGIIKFYRTKNRRERTEFLILRTKVALLARHYRKGIN
jgi:integrase